MSRLTTQSAATSSSVITDSQGTRRVSQGQHRGNDTRVRTTRVRPSETKIPTAAPLPCERRRDAEWPPPESLPIPAFSSRGVPHGTRHLEVASARGHRPRLHLGCLPL